MKTWGGDATGRQREIINRPHAGSTFLETAAYEMEIIEKQDEGQMCILMENSFP